MGLHSCVFILPLRGPCGCGGSGEPRVQWGGCAEALGGSRLKLLSIAQLALVFVGLFLLDSSVLALPLGLVGREMG